MEFERKPHAVLFTTLGLGQIIPFSEFARLIAIQHSCKVTFITLPLDPNYHLQQHTILGNLASSALDIELLPLTGMLIEDITKNKTLSLDTQNLLLVDRAIPYIETALRCLKVKADAFIVDSFCTSMPDMSAKLGIPCYVFYTSAVSMFALMLSFPKFAEPNKEKLLRKDPNLTVSIDGLPKMEIQDLPAPLQDPSNQAFTRYVDRRRLYNKFCGIFANTFEDLEHSALQVLRLRKEDLLPKHVPPVFAIGPVIASQEAATGQNSLAACSAIDWLDKQSKSSVLFVSFGSVSTLSERQVTELAEGLRESGQRFLWVLRKPEKGNLVRTLDDDIDVGGLLPRGFLEDTESRGMVVSSWVPQMSILTHDSVGGFMYHGGWNSTLESICHGVPTIMWPRFGDQCVTRQIVTEQMGCGIPVKMETDGFVKKEEVERCVRELMEGEGGGKARNAAKEMMGKAKASLAVGGDSFCALAHGVSMWRDSFAM